MDTVVALCAIIGAVLGVFNFFRAYFLEKERLKVNYIWGSIADGSPEIEVINKSGFAITITDVGQIGSDGEQESILIERSDLSVQLPARIDPHHSQFFQYDPISNAVTNATVVYATTALGKRVTNEPTFWERLTN